MKKEYRIKEKKFKHISEFIPQYHHDNSVNDDKTDKWQDFTHWQKGIIGEPELVSTIFYSKENAIKAIEIDIRLNEAPIEEIIHQY
jgi:hypothetical protein